MVASVSSGRRTGSPRARRMSNACGDVTSCTRCRSMYRIAGVSLVSGTTTWVSQTLSDRVRPLIAVIMVQTTGSGDGLSRLFLCAPALDAIDDFEGGVCRCFGEIAADPGARLLKAGVRDGEYELGRGLQVAGHAPHATVQRC